jgi:hypothetical protein
MIIRNGDGYTISILNHPRINSLTFVPYSWYNRPGEPGYVTFWIESEITCFNITCKALIVMTLLAIREIIWWNIQKWLLR